MRARTLRAPVPRALGRGSRAGSSTPTRTAPGGDIAPRLVRARVTMVISNVFVARSSSIELAAVTRAVLVDDHGGEVLHGLVDGAEERELHERQEEDEKERAASRRRCTNSFWITATNEAQKLPGLMLASPCAGARPSRSAPVSVTNTSSSDGSIVAHRRRRSRAAAQLVDDGVVVRRSRVDHGVDRCAEDGRARAERLLSAATRAPARRGASRPRARRVPAG